MIDFTSLIKLVCRGFDLEFPCSDNAVWTAAWSQRLYTEFNIIGENLIEQVMFALTCIFRLGWHPHNIWCTC